MTVAIALHPIRIVFSAAALCGALLFLAPLAHAGSVNDWACRPSPARPFPAVLVHGRSGHFTDMAAISAALLQDGYCVFGSDYGQVNGGGQTGMDHLTVSGGELAAFVSRVLAATGAPQIDLVGYSEGTGVVDNFILQKGGAPLVHRAVSFAGLHHPYAHAGASGYLDNDLYLPNMVAAARRIDPALTAQQVITSALDVYGAAGGQLGWADREIATSNFVDDLFNPTYWIALQGGLSEPDFTFLRLATDGHSLITHDAAASVCYTNLVSPGDLLAGASAGFQDPAPNVDNIVLLSLADHGGIINDVGAIADLVSGLDAPCGPTPGTPSASTNGGAAPGGAAEGGAPEAGGGAPGTAAANAPGCSISDSGSGAAARAGAAGFALVALAILFALGRRRIYG